MRRKLLLSVSLLIGLCLPKWAQAVELTVDGDYYLISSSADLAAFASLVNEGNTGINARLTANITYGGEEFVLISPTSETCFIGVFDGQGNTITINATATQANFGLFGYLGGTLKNIIIKGTIETNYRNTAGISGRTSNAIIENCICSVNILTTLADDASSGGLIGETGGTNYIRNTVFNGSIKGDSWNCGGFIGWTWGHTYCDNCLQIGTIDLGKVDNGNTFGRLPDRLHLTNCYYMTKYDNDVAGTIQVTYNQLKSGEVCFLLNQPQEAVAWTQTLGTDRQPVPFITHGTVYASSKLNCDGSLIGDPTFTNDAAEESKIPDHEYGENGFCVNCGTLNPAFLKEVDGFYQIGTPADMAAFVYLVNKGSDGINAKLTADIAYEGSEMIGAGTISYTGAFDGQGHTITVNMTATQRYYALFWTLSGTVKNLTIKGTITTEYGNAAGIAGRASNATIENCVSSVDIVSNMTGDAAHGGFIGETIGGTNYIRNSMFCGSIKGENTWNCGGFIGWTWGHTYFDNCLQIGEIDVKTGENGNTFGRLPERAHTTNCYYKQAYDGVIDGTVQVTDDQLASGEACYMLNGKAAGTAWRQTIGEDEHPVLVPTHGIVNNIGETGYATMYLPETSVIVPTGVTANAAVINEPWVTTTPLGGNVILVGTPVVLQGNAGFYSFKPIIVDGATEQAENDLKGTAEPLQTTGTQYVLAQKDGVVGFYKAEGTIPAGKAYIEYAGAGVKGFAVGGATSIQNAQFIMHNDDAIYDVSGCRVEKATKGIFIVNGRKVLR